jgi:hypothetical protein
MANATVLHASPRCKGKTIQLEINTRYAADDPRVSKVALNTVVRGNLSPKHKQFYALAIR